MSHISIYVKRVRDSLLLLVLISAAAAFIAFLITTNISPRYEVHFSYLISLSQREDTPGEFRFDGYYALQATELFSQTIASWVQGPEVIVDAYGEAGLDVPVGSARQLMKHVDADLLAPQLVRVVVRDRTRERAEQLARGLQRVMEQNIDYYHDEGIPAVTFRVVPTDSWTGVTRLSVPVVVVATFTFTLFVSVNVLLLLESLKDQDQQGQRVQQDQ